MVLMDTDTPSERQLAVSKLVQTLTAYQRMVILSPVCLEGNSIPGLCDHAMIMGLCHVDLGRSLTIRSDAGRPEGFCSSLGG